MFMLPLCALIQRIAEPISFLPPFFPPRWNFHASASMEKGLLPPLPPPGSASASLAKSELKFLMSVRFSKDVLENVFSQIRAKK